MTSDEENFKTIRQSPSLILAERDVDLLARPELRAVRLQLEFLKPELSLVEHQIKSTIVVFGSTEIREREKAEARLKKAQDLAAQDPGNARRARQVSRCERLLAKCHY